MKVKVCGLKYLNNISAITSCGADLLGFVFYKGSSRYLDGSLSFDEARQVRNKVGVFVNEDVYSILNTVAHYDLDYVQLHGNEDPGACKELKKYVKVIKAFGVDETFNFEILKNYEGLVDHFLFDTMSRSHGGSGKKFDHALLKRYRLKTSFFLSGGISTTDIPVIKAIGIKQLAGIDINSRFETEPGLKDVNKVKQFIAQLK